MTRKLPRGIRNNNPGNIDRTAEKWQGMADDQSSDSRFIVFVSPEWGIRAMAKILRNYGKKYGINSVDGIINRWAPPVENDTGSYVRQVAEALGVDKHERINLEDPAILVSLIKSIIKHENGIQPYDDSQIAEGVRRALA